MTLLTFLTFLGFVATAVSGCIWAFVLIDQWFGQVKLEQISGRGPFFNVERNEQ